MKNLSTLLGASGVAAALAGLFVYLIAPQWRWTVTVLEALAAVCLLWFFVVHFEAVRAFSTKRSTKFGTNSLLMAVIFLAILVILNFLFNRHFGRVDLSEGGSFSLSPQSRQVLSALTQEVGAVGFFKDGSPTQTQARDLMETYRYHSPNFKYELVDPDKQPGVANQYKITHYDTVVVEARGDGNGEGGTSLESPDTRTDTGALLTEVPAGQRSVTLRSISEQELTNAIVRVTRTSRKVIYFTEGHGEHDLEDGDRDGYAQAKAALERQGFEVKRLLLLGEAMIPEDADVVVIGGPQKPFLPREIEALEAYLGRGGQLFVMIDPLSGSGLEGFLSRHGVKLNNDLVIDPFSRLAGVSINVPIVGPAMYLPHPLTDDFNLPTLFPLVRSVSPIDSQEGPYRFQGIVQTSANSWATSKVKGPPSNFDEQTDRRGPITIGAVVGIDEGAEGLSAAARKARLVLFGDSDFAANNSFLAAGNGDLFQNVVSWLTQEEDLIAIRPKEARLSALLLTAQQGNFLFYFPVIILPGAVLLAGLTVWRKRRRL